MHDAWVTIRAIIAKKSAFILLLTIGYLAVLAGIKWRMQLSIDMLWFLMGGIVGIYLFDAAEVVFAVKPSPFRSIVFVLAFLVVAFFVLSSSVNMFGKGMIMTLLFTIVLWQSGELRVTGTLERWYALVQKPVSVRLQKQLYGALLLVTFGLSLLFIRS
jgi:hypothetical protein